MVGGLPPSPLFVVRPLKKTLFLCVSSLRVKVAKKQERVDKGFLNKFQLFNNYEVHGYRIVFVPCLMR